MYKNLKKFIVFAIVTSFMLVSMINVYADDCDPTYGGGNYGGGTCIINKRFSIEKEVRIEGDNEWKDKITGVEADDVIEFKITVENLSDEEADEFDNMKVEDFLPDELERVGGSGLTEYFDNFGSGDEKTFTIEAQIKSDEFDRDDNFEKCVVNKAEVSYDGEFEGADAAAVCYGNV